MKSPCLAQCKLDDEDNCMGCFRSRDEIMSWTKLTDEQRQAVIDRVAPTIQRRLSSNKN